MTDTCVRRLTGFAGILAAVLGAVLVPLYFTYSGPPPAWNVLARNMINLIAAVAILVFLLAWPISYAAPVISTTSSPA
jgi:hypothetical protein